jgi:PAS domain S-box-containing protein
VNESAGLRRENESGGDAARDNSLLRAIFDGALDAMLLADDESRYVDVNLAACKLFGLRREELLHRGVGDFTRPGDAAVAAYHAFCERGRTRGQFTLYLADGSRHTLDCSATANVAPGLHLSVLHDITERVVAEEALRLSEARFRVLIEKSAEGTSLTAADGSNLYRSPAISRMLGWTPEEMAGRPWMDNVFPDDRASFAADVKRLMRGEGREVSLQFRACHQDGSVRWMEGSVTNFLDDPDVRAVVAHFRDITERKRSEDGLRRNEALFRAVIEKSTEVMSLTTADGATRYLTPSAWRLLGWTPDEMGTRTLRDQVIPEDRARIVTELDHLVRSGARDMSMEFRVQHRDGTIRWIESSGTNLLDDPNVQAIVGNYRDITARKRSEDSASRALLEAELGRRRLESVLAALPVGVWIADLDGQLVQSNPAASRIWGGRAPHAKDPSEYGVYKGFWPTTGRALRPEDWALSRMFATGETIVAEAVDIERFDGTRGHVLTSTAPIVDEQGGMIGGVVVLLDVTEAHEAAREREGLVASLEHERRRLGTLLERAPAFIAVVRGKDHVFELVNEAYGEVTGRRDLIGKPLVEALPEMKGQPFIELLNQVLETGEPFVGNGIPVTLTRRAGSEPEQRFVNFVYQPLVEADGTRSGVFVHGVDVTDATIAQQRVRAQFHGVPVPTYVWQRVERDGAKQFVLVDFNEAAVTISRGAIAIRLGETAQTYFADVPGVLDELDRCLDQGVTLQREMEWTLKSTGERKHLCVTYASAPPGLVIVHTEDVTARKKLEEQFRQAQKMEAVGRLAGGVAHDFNNLLSVILSYAGMAVEDLEPGDPLRSDLQSIQAAGQRAAGLVRQLLAFSRQQVLQPQVVDLGLIVTEMESMLGRLLGEDIQLTVLTGQELGRVLADAGQIEQVVMNLAVNARDAMPGGGKLTVELGNRDLDAAYARGHLGVVPGEYVVLAVTDTGTGMDASTCARIFEPFFTTKEQGKGTGLGLSTVFGIVEQSRGHVGVCSELGHGTTFEVYLPRTDRIADVPGSERSAAPRGGAETILLVEDEEQVRLVACEILRRNGYRVIETSNGGEALLASKDFKAEIHLLLTDVVMPRMGGQKLAEHLARERPDMKLLFASGYNDDAVIQHGVLEGGVAFVQKPFTPEVLLSKVRQALDATPYSAPGNHR